VAGCSTHNPGTTMNIPGTHIPAYTPTFTPIIPSNKGKIAFVYWNNEPDIYVINSDGSGLQNLTADLGPSWGPVWSPDGKYIVFSSQPGLDMVPQIYEFGSHTPVWSPDGKFILFLSKRDGDLSLARDIPRPEIYLMRSDGSDQRRLTNNQHLNMNSLSWSPKGDMIAVSIGDPAKGRYSIEIYLLGLDGKIKKQLTEVGINYSPVWSPNGEFIAFYTLGRGDCSRISIMKADGSSPVCLIIDKASPPVQNSSVSWLPDSQHLIFSSNLDGDFDLYMVKSDGTDLIRLTNEPGDETFADWSPVP